MNDLMNEFDPEEQDTDSQRNEDSWSSLLGGLLKEMALASSDTLARRLRRAEAEITEEEDSDSDLEDEEDVEPDVDADESERRDAEADVYEVESAEADFQESTFQEIPVPSSAFGESMNGQASLQHATGADGSGPLPSDVSKPTSRAPRGPRSRRSGKPDTEETLAKRVLNWSAGTLLSNIADNDELDELIDRQLRKRIPQLAHDPAVQELIRAQAGMYLAYLLETP